MMQNFQFYNPTRIIFGEGQIATLNTLIAPETRILLLYGGGSIFKNGIYDQVKTALSGYDITEFGGVEANPRLETLMKAVEIIRQEKLDFILAVGGGSVIDGAKFISATINYEGDPREILRQRMSIKSNTLPFGTVLTLPATGSEMNSGSVVTIEETKEKLPFGGPALFPKFSVCDPRVVASLPQRQLQNGVVDAFTHVMEQYLTYPAGGILQDRLAEGILQTLVEIGPQVVANPGDYTLAANLTWSCSLALNGLIHRGVPTDWATHMIGHELTALYDIDHARTLAIILPHLYRALFDEKKAKLAQYGRRVWGLDGENEEQIAHKAIARTEAFLDRLGMDRKLSAYTSDTAGTAGTIVERFQQRGWTKLGENGIVTLEKVREIVNAAL